MSYTDTDLTNQQLIVCDEDDIDELDLSTIPDGSIIATRDESGGSGGVTITTLWTNPNPTSNFSAQSITLNSSDWDLLIINWKTNNWPYGNGRINSIFKKSNIIINNEINQTASYVYSDNYWNVALIGRTYKFTNYNTIEFNAGSYIRQGKYTEETSNAVMVPLEVIGIKVGV